MTIPQDEKTAAQACTKAESAVDVLWDEVIAKLKAQPAREPCKHEWNNGGMNPEYCLKCGMSIMAHAFMECP